MTELHILDKYPSSDQIYEGISTVEIAERRDNIEKYAHNNTPLLGGRMHIVI